MNTIYNRRRALLVSGLKALKITPYATGATFYVWCDVPTRFSSAMEFCKMLLEKAGIVATPGDGFGQNGKGFVRFTITVPETRIREAMKRMKEVL